MKKVKLGEVCDKESSNIAQKDLESNIGEYPVYGASGLIKKIDFYKQKKDYIAIVKDGAGVGRIMLLPAYSSVIGTMQYIIPNEKVDIRYLSCVLTWMDLSKYCTGATIPHIYFKDYKDETFNLPSLEEQKEIADRLDKVSSLIEKRKTQLEKLDQLIKSRFIELFGDRYTNDKNWENKPLYECADFYNGKAHEQVVDENGEYILVTSRCIASDITDYRRTNALLFPLKINDIAMVMSDVPNGRALAKCILIDEDDKYTLNQRICCLRNYSFNPIFFYYLLNRHEYFLSFNDGNAQTNLRKDDLLACNIIMPPLELQNQFAAFVEQTDKSKLAIQKSIDKLETLKKSLMQQYFG